ncbi:MAG TPA: NHLP leader peptide family RiPP precursor [Pedobacter sp.]
MCTLKSYKKAWEDPQFKSELMANPAEAIEKATGHKLNLPAGKTLVVRDQTDESTVYINIPAKLNTEDVELNENQLEAVAGGAAGHPFTPGPFFPATTNPVGPFSPDYFN